MSELIRSFVAIELPEELKTQIGGYIRDLSHQLPLLRWVKKDALHITLKFLGEQSPEQTDRVIESLLSLPGTMKHFRLTIKTSGAFPSPQRPRVIWLGIRDESGRAVANLHTLIEGSLEPLGFAKDKRKFAPHLTLARVKFPQDFSHFWPYVEQNPFKPFSFEVSRFVLMRSFLKRSGAEYRVVQSFKLSNH